MSTGEEGKRLMVSADVARSDMSRLINLKFIAGFGPSTPSVTDATSFSKVAMRILQLIFKRVNNSRVAHNESGTTIITMRTHYSHRIQFPRSPLTPTISFHRPNL